MCVCVERVFCCCCVYNFPSIERSAWQRFQKAFFSGVRVCVCRVFSSISYIVHFAQMCRHEGTIFPPSNLSLPWPSHPHAYENVRSWFFSPLLHFCFIFRNWLSSPSLSPYSTQFFGIILPPLCVFLYLSAHTHAMERKDALERIWICDMVKWTLLSPLYGTHVV